MSKYSGIAHYQDFNELVKLLGQSNSTYDIDKITKAYKFAEKAHGDQRRVSGIPYILHPTSVVLADILTAYGIDVSAEEIRTTETETLKTTVREKVRCDNGRRDSGSGADHPCSL